VTINELQEVQAHLARLIRSAETMRTTPVMLDHVLVAKADYDAVCARIERVRRLDIGRPLPQGWDQDSAGS
jgi:hypothetical protein